MPTITCIAAPAPSEEDGNDIGIAVMVPFLIFVLLSPGIVIGLAAYHAYLRDADQVHVHHVDVAHEVTNVKNGVNNTSGGDNFTVDKTHGGEAMPVQPLEPESAWEGRGR